MKLLISVATVVMDGFTDAHVERVREAAGDRYQVVVATTPEDRLLQAADAEIVFGALTREMFERATRLRWVQTDSSGIDTLMFDEFKKSPVVLVSAKGTVGPHLADHTWALALGLLRGIGIAVRARSWEVRRPIRRLAWELGGRTLGVIGLGGTGVEVARRAPGFGMRVIAIDPEPVERPTFVEALWTPDRFHDLLEQSDIIAVCCPLTRRTRHMFDHEAFRHTQPHAILTNVTRGPIIDFDALLEALNERRLAAAGLDSTEPEPLPAGSPLWDHPQAIVTPHVAGASPLRMDRAIDRFCENLRRYEQGRPLEGVIDKEKEY